MQGEDSRHEKRLQVIETKLAYVEDLVVSLNDIVAAQSAELEDARRKLKSLAEQAAERDAQAREQATAPEVERPPHY